MDFRYISSIQQIYLNSQNSTSQASTACEPWTSRCSRIQERQMNQRSNCQHPLDHRKSKGIPEKIDFCLIDNAKVFDCVDHNKLWKILKDMEIPDHLTCLLRNLYAGQEANSQNWTWNNELVQNWERNTTRLYIVTLFI